MEVVASLSQGRTAAAQCGLFTHKSVPVIFEPPCTIQNHKQTISTVSPLHRHSATYAIVTFQTARSKSTCAPVVCKHLLHVQSTVQGSPAEFQIQTHRNLISSSMTATVSCVIAQQHSSVTFVSSLFHYHKEKFGAPINNFSPLKSMELRNLKLRKLGRVCSCGDWDWD